MKHYYSFLIITSLLLAGCGQKDRAKFQFESSVQTEESYPLAKEYIKDFEIFFQTQFIENPEKYESLNELKRALPHMEYHELRVLRDYFTEHKK